MEPRSCVEESLVSERSERELRGSRQTGVKDKIGEKNNHLACIINLWVIWKFHGCHNAT